MVFFNNLLNWVLLLPVLGTIAVLASPKQIARWVALAFASATLVVTIMVFAQMRTPEGSFDVGAVLTGHPESWAKELTYYYRTDWFSFSIGDMAINIDYFLGVDGISLPLVILTALLTVLAVIGGWKKENVKNYLALILFLEMGVLGVFMALDLFLFFLFWEIELGPMFLLIGVWGGKGEKHGMLGRVYSAWKFLIYTFLGSVFMIAGIIMLYIGNVQHGGTPSAAITDIKIFDGTIGFFGATLSVQMVTFLLIFVAFAVKMPMVPFHTWLPDAHTDAPTEVSVLLAGVLLKMGSYGFIRFCVGLFPQAIHSFAPYLAVLGVIGIIYGAAICLVQKDLKKLIAYSSVSHMGIILLGVAAAVGAGDGFFSNAHDQEVFRQAALLGAVLQNVSHGLITGLLFFCVGVIYDHAHTRQIADFGGVAKKMPMLATLFVFAALASAGLPGLAGFVAEYMVFTGSFGIFTIPTTIAVFTMILTAAYLLWMIKRVFFGDFNPRWSTLKDASLREMVPLIVLAALVVVVGIYPKVVIDVLQPSLEVLFKSTMAFIQQGGH